MTSKEIIVIIETGRTDTSLKIYERTILNIIYLCKGTSTDLPIQYYIPGRVPSRSSLYFNPAGVGTSARVRANCPGD